MKKKLLKIIISAIISFILTYNLKAIELYLPYFSTTYLLINEAKYVFKKRGEEFNEKDTILLSNYASELIRGFSEERALKNAIFNIKKKKEEKYNKILLKIINGEDVNNIFEKYYGKKLLNIIPYELMKKNSIKAGKILQQRIHRFNELINLMKERREILHIMEFRTNIMIFTFSFSLAILTLIAPNLTLLYSKPNYQFNINELILINSLMIVTCSYLCSKATFSKKTFRIIIIALMIFLVTFMMFSQLLVLK
ncbi:MAG: hypothetical protein QXF09_02030 [Nitrososphaerota archaeon]